MLPSRGKAIQQYFFPCAELSQQQHQNLVPAFLKGKKKKPFSAVSVLNTLSIKSFLRRHTLFPNVHIYKEVQLNTLQKKEITIKNVSESVCMLI